MTPTDSAEQRIRQLQLQVAHLMQEVERYRRAAEDALEQVDWCIGYFTATRQQSIARSLAANRANVRRNLMHRAEQPLPPPSAAGGGGS